ncbi:energy transducer TonB [Algibacter miyuki]|uniref:Energy transducer TonB n=1 Tax=Algibacter miyuki TaxID=1306933 RepID=A0ABV5H381_9FLAO|nr:energy transducer TonB [Algibacter miyuki]MDN3666538.1 energy transducer TonB [Algibacter miyuki]
MEVKKNPEIEVGRNSSLYFAIGLNLMLFLSWLALEHKTYVYEDVAVETVNMEVIYEEDIPIITSKIPPAPAPPPIVVSQSIEIVDDMVEIEETVIESTETGQDDAISEHIVAVGDVIVERMEEEVEVAFAVIEEVPVFPGCEGLDRAQTKACFQKKMQAHVVKNFNYPQTALDMGIQGRVSVVFIINSEGVTTNVRSRGPDKILEVEAERIISLLPKMQPGKQRGKAVKVAYAVPIFFKYES